MPRRSDTRDRLLDAGWRTFDELPLERVFAGLTSAAVADRAGVTTGAFFHHFADVGEFVDALVMTLRQEPSDFTELTDELTDSLAHVDFIEMLRSTMNEAWEVYTGEEDIRRQLRVHMAMWAHARSDLCRPTGEYERVADVFVQQYGVRQRDAVNGWRHLLERTGRTFIEPFTLDRLAVAMTAMFEGLRIRAAVDPDHVDDELLGDMCAAVAAALTAPPGSSARLSEMTVRLAPDLTNLSPQARSGAQRRRRTRQRVVAAAEGMFGRGWEDVSVTDVAEAAGVANQTVTNLFGGVRGVAAATFARHVGPVEAAAAPDAADEAPEHRLRRAVQRLAEVADADPEPARALLAERLAAELHHAAELQPMDVRSEVPLAPCLAGPLAGLGLCEEGDQSGLAATLVDVVLTRSVGARGRTAETTELAMALVAAAPLLGEHHDGGSGGPGHGGAGDDGGPEPPAG